MKKVSIRSNAYNEFVGYVGVNIKATFPDEWTALDWLQGMYERGHTISTSSNFSAEDVQKHSRKGLS